MRDENAFRSSGTPGRKEEIGGIVGGGFTDLERWVQPRFVREHDHRRFVELCDRVAGGSGRRGVDHERAAAGPFEDVAVSRCGIARIERYVAVPAEEGSEDAGKCPGAAAAEDRGQPGSVPGLTLDESRRDCGGAMSQFGIRELLPIDRQGRPLRESFGGREKARGERPGFSRHRQAAPRRAACSNATAVCSSSSASGGMSTMNVLMPSSMYRASSPATVE